MSNLRRSLPPLGTLAAFEAAARLGSFTRAAEELALTQAAVSRQIRQLEEDLGTALFQRRRHDVRLSEAGEAFAATAVPALRALSEGAARLRRQSAHEGLLTVYCDLGLAGGLLIKQLGPFAMAHPEVELRLVTSDQPIERTETAFDLGLQSGIWVPERFEIILIAKDEILPVCSPALRARLPARPAAADLAAMPLLHLDQPGRKWEDWADFFAHHGGGGEEGAARRGPVFSNYRNALDAAMQGVGLALGWQLTVREELERGSLVEIEGLRIPTRHHLHAYLPRERKINPNARGFVAWLKEAARPR